MRIGFKEHKTLQAFNPQRLQKLSSKTLHEFLGVRYAAEDDGQVSGKKLFGVDVICGQVGVQKGWVMCFFSTNSTVWATDLPISM